MGIYACEDVCVNINNTKSQKHTKQKEGQNYDKKKFIKKQLY